MVLSPHLKGYRPFDERFTFLFNSYYETLGARQPRPRRGMITRPALDEVYAYRAHVDHSIERLLGSRPTREVAELIELGCHHEQQHQELLLTDVLHLFAQNPIRPAYRDPALVSVETGVLPALSFTDFEGGIVEIGHGGAGFAFDSEGPRHRVLTEPFRLADRLVTNAEWMEFIEDGGYTEPLLWLSEGWAKVLAEGWSHPLYWEMRDGQHWTMTLRGFQLVDPTAPVAHVSYFRGRCVRHVVRKAAAQRGGVGGGRAETRRGGQRRVQWQIHVRAVRFARRLLRDPAGTPARELPQFLPGAHALAIRWTPLGGGRVAPAQSVKPQGETR
jgi:ergothioneine biosynthesis protein EgtB